MKHDLDPTLVEARLAELAELYVPETVDEARVRLARERPPVTDSFETLVERRLQELRALDELTRHLHREVTPRLRVHTATLRHRDR